MFDSPQDSAPTVVFLHEKQTRTMTTKLTILTLLMAALWATESPAQPPRGGGGGGGGVGDGATVGGESAPRAVGRGGRGGFGGAVPGSIPLSDSETAELPHFSLDFPGGTPQALVKMIESASGNPLNAIIPPEYQDTMLPPLKMRSVTVPDLFNALIHASVKSIAVATGNSRTSFGDRQYTYSFQNYVCGFRTEGKPRPDSVWYFFVDQPVEPLRHAPAECRYFQLGGYLENYKIDDITTAIETGWKMLGEKPYPQLSFHKDTKLLIAVGEPEKLRLIDSVLEQLRGAKPPANTNGTLDSRLDRSADPNRR
jgi:hypothetical protein